jgi:asparagine synthase (glutamine-hydrolysing)
VRHIGCAASISASRPIVGHRPPIPTGLAGESPLRVRWFGGRISSGQEHEAVPRGCHLLRTTQRPIWTVGEWTRTEIRTVGVGDRQVMVFGECAATDPELHRLAAHGVTNDVLTAFADSYTVVETTARLTTVFTDPGHARPIYLSDTSDGVVWGSARWRWLP